MGRKARGRHGRGGGLLALPLLGAMSLPFLGDDIFVLIAAELDARMLGRLGCAAQRFWWASVPDPAHKGSALPELWSVAEEGAVATGTNWRTAVCGGHKMRRGRHYATFTRHTLGYGAAMLGVVGVGFDPTTGDEANMSPQGWMLYTGSGCLCNAGASDSKGEGQPGKWELKEGDVVVRPTPLCLSHGVAHSVCLWRRACCSTSTRPP